MYKVDNQKTGQYIKKLIYEKFKNQADFCRAYLKIESNCDDLNESQLPNIKNQISQILLGNKAIQTYELPIFSHLLDVSCEQILSAGEYNVPKADRPTLYSVAYSSDANEWEDFVQREDKLILNSDEYNKTVIDYALEFKNYDFLKYLLDKGYIWFDCNDEKLYNHLTFGAGTSIKRRDPLHIDRALEHELMNNDQLRQELITLAIDNNDIEMLTELRAREFPMLYHSNPIYRTGSKDREKDYDEGFNEIMVEQISHASGEIIDYFTEKFQISSKNKNAPTRTFMFPYTSELTDLLVKKNSDQAMTVIEKSIVHNEKVYEELKKLIILMKDSQFYENELCKNLWKTDLKDWNCLYTDKWLVHFCTCRCDKGNNLPQYMETNIIHATACSNDSKIDSMIQRLNKSYNLIQNILNDPEEILK